MTKTYYYFTDDGHYCGFVNLLDGMSLADMSHCTDAAPPNADPATGTGQVYDLATKTWVPAEGSTSTTTGKS